MSSVSEELRGEARSEEELSLVTVLAADVAAGHRNLLQEAEQSVLTATSELKEQLVALGRAAGSSFEVARHFQAAERNTELLAAAFPIVSVSCLHLGAVESTSSALSAVLRVSVSCPYPADRQHLRFIYSLPLAAVRASLVLCRRLAEDPKTVPLVAKAVAPKLLPVMLDLLIALCELQVAVLAALEPILDILGHSARSYSARIVPLAARLLDSPVAAVRAGSARVLALLALPPAAGGVGTGGGGSSVATRLAAALLELSRVTLNALEDRSDGSGGAGEGAAARQLLDFHAEQLPNPTLAPRSFAVATARRAGAVLDAVRLLVVRGGAAQPAVRFSIGELLDLCRLALSIDKSRMSPPVAAVADSVLPAVYVAALMLLECLIQSVGTLVFPYLNEVEQLFSLPLFCAKGSVHDSKRVLVASLKCLRVAGVVGLPLREQYVARVCGLLGAAAAAAAAAKDDARDFECRAGAALALEGILCGAAGPMLSRAMRSSVDVMVCDALQEAVYAPQSVRGRSKSAARCQLLLSLYRVLIAVVCVPPMDGGAPLARALHLVDVGCRDELVEVRIDCAQHRAVLGALLRPRAPPFPRTAAVAARPLRAAEGSSDSLMFSPDVASWRQAERSSDSLAVSGDAASWRQTERVATVLGQEDVARTTDTVRGEAGSSSAVLNGEVGVPRPGGDQSSNIVSYEEADALLLATVRQPAAERPVETSPDSLARTASRLEDELLPMLAADSGDEELLGVVDAPPDDTHAADSGDDQLLGVVDAPPDDTHAAHH